MHIMEEKLKLSPFVYWAQTEGEVSLRVELRNVKAPQIEIEGDSLHFSAIGVGAKGETNYEFDLNFYLPVDTEKSKYRFSDRQIDFSLHKLEPKFWPRLLLSSQKPAWLKIDFEKWQHEDDLEDEARDIMDDYPGLYEKIQAEELGWASKRESMKKVYLFLYNLWQFVGFLYIVIVILTRYSKSGKDSMEGTYEAVSWMMKLCFMTQFLEIFHPLLGYTKGSVLEPLMQVSGRGIVFFCLIVAEERMQTKPVIFYLFLVWSFIEVIRYPYYLLRVYDIEIGLLTWLRYSIWMPLYPLGIVLEGVVMLRSILTLKKLRNLLY
ncbi:Very-long-chain (3R)-3-hydroxyacyl-CoA dehydratase 3, partial [Armadillidium nasatum]